MDTILQSFTNIRIYILLSFILVLILSNRKTLNHKLAFYIISLSLINEIITGFFTVYFPSFRLNTNLYVIINACLWFYVLKINFQNNLYLKIIVFYFCFAIINLILYDGFHQFNNTNFIVASIIYIILFIAESNKLLIKEKLDFFTSNNYLLLFSPVLFFIGFSFMLSFKSKELITFNCFNNIKLYTLIGNFVNIIYYSILNFYIYRDRKTNG